MKRYGVITKSRRYDPCNHTNATWAGGQIEDDNYNFSSLEAAISCGRRLAKEQGYTAGEIRVCDREDDRPYEQARAFELSGARRLI
jgi:hypothetical protein